MANPIEAEFKVGDIVHYRGAGDHPVSGLPATVREIHIGMFGGCYFNGEPDRRIFYSLRGSRDPGDRATRNVVVDTTGRCIIESSLYIPPSP